MDKQMELIIEKIKTARHEKNMSQRALAYACEIPQSTLARIESGKTVPQLDTLLKITDVLNLSLSLESVKSDIPAIRRWDGLRFSLYWRNELIAKVSVTNTTAEITRFVLHPAKQIFWSDKMNIVQLSEVLESRCWERNRDDIDVILKNLGLKSYDPLEIVKKTHGVSYNDSLWIQFEGEKLSYRDVMTRRCSNV